VSTFEPVSEGARLVPGETYRIRATVRGPYNAAVTGALRLAFDAQLVLKGNTVLGHDHAPPLWDMHTNALGPWPYLVTFRPPPAPDPNAPMQAGIDARAVAGIVAAVIALVLAVALVSSKLEHLVATVADESRKTVHELGGSLLSPGTIILVVLAIALVVGAVGKARA